LSKTKKKCSQLRLFDPYPTVSRNLHVKDKSVIHSQAVQSVIHKFEKQLHGHGKLVVRASGTEQVIRILVESENVSDLEQMVNDLSQIIH
jgi:phosphoglucosamine mutase